MTKRREIVEDGDVGPMIQSHIQIIISLYNLYLHKYIDYEHLKFYYKKVPLLVSHPACLPAWTHTSASVVCVVDLNFLKLFMGIRVLELKC